MFELTERNPVLSNRAMLYSLARMKSNGIPLSLDDFGTGFSSLSLLADTPFDELKIDQRFVFRMLDDPEADAIVRGTIRLAHSLGRVVCAEAVESLEIETRLKEYGCDRAQGFYYAKPLPSDEFQEWILESKRAMKSAAN